MPLHVVAGFLESERRRRDSGVWGMNGMVAEVWRRWIVVRICRFSNCKMMETPWVIWKGGHSGTSAGGEQIWRGLGGLSKANAPARDPNWTAPTTILASQMLSTAGYKWKLCMLKQIILCRALSALDRVWKQAKRSSIKVPKS